jgi:molecular chaperone DnaK (HSP70)
VTSALPPWWAARPTSQARPRPRTFELALGRLRTAAAQGGFDDVVFELEPVAAAYRYQQQLGGEELVGGSSFVPAVRRLFAERFGAERLRGGDELTTAAMGLALSR